MIDFKLNTRYKVSQYPLNIFNGGTIVRLFLKGEVNVDNTLLLISTSKNLEIKNWKVNNFIVGMNITTGNIFTKLMNQKIEYEIIKLT